MCACVSPCFDSPGPPPENSKGLFILHLAFSSIITTELWSHHELHTYSLLHAHVYAHIRQINMYSFTHDDTHQHGVTHMHKTPHTSHRAVGLLCNLNRSFSGEKHVLLFHFISFDCATSHPPPFLPQLYHSATCSPPQTPLLKSQATSRAPTAALSCWPCDDLSVHSVCLWTDMDMQMKGSSTFEFLRECQCNINVTKQSGL